MDYIQVLASLFFLFLNAFFVLVEFAIVRARITKIEELAQAGNKVAKLAHKILININSYLASIQLGITIASIGLGWLAQPLVTKIINSFLINVPWEIIKFYSYTISISISFIVVTAIHIILGEQVPKYIAISFAEKITLIFAIPLSIFYQITYYPMLIINNSANLIIKLMGIKKIKEENIHSEDEIKLILSKTEEIGKITLSRLMIFEQLFDFGKTIVKEIMTPIERVIHIDKNIKFADFLNILKTYKFSRYPIKDGDNFIGFIHVKDVIINFSCFNDDNFDVLKFIRPIKSISHKMPLEKALRYFQENNLNISLVENDNKEIVGFISVEDIIEDFVGEIRDEFEKRPKYRLDEIVEKQHSIMNLKSRDRISAIEELVNNFFITHKVNFSKTDVIDRLIKREKAFSTAIGHGFAIPHARIDNISKPIVIIGKSEEGIYFNSPDNKPVHFVFLIITPYNEPSLQLNILSKISKLISNVLLRKKLLKANNIEQIINVFTIFEDSIPVD